MTTGWRIVDCTAMTGILRYKRGQLVIEHHDLETRIPLADTAVLLLGVQTAVSTALLQQLRSSMWKYSYANGTKFQ